MTKNKFPRSVSFNTNNAVDKAILEFMKRRNFSGYVKKLIVADMRAKGIEIPSNTRKVEAPTAPIETKLERLKRQLESAKNVNNNPQSHSDS